MNRRPVLILLLIGVLVALPACTDSDPDTSGDLGSLGSPIRDGMRQAVNQITFRFSQAAGDPFAREGLSIGDPLDVEVSGLKDLKLRRDDIDFRSCEPRPDRVPLNVSLIDHVLEGGQREVQPDELVIPITYDMKWKGPSSSPLDPTKVTATFVVPPVVSGYGSTPSFSYVGVQVVATARFDRVPLSACNLPEIVVSARRSLRIPSVRIEIPTVLVLAVGKDLQGPGILVVVPATLPFAQRSALLEGAVRPALRTLEGAQTALQGVPAFAGTLALLTPLKAINGLLESGTSVQFRRRTTINDLNGITLVQRGYTENDTEAENEISSLMLIGPPGATVDLYNDTDRRAGNGHLRVSVRAQYFVRVGNLHVKSFEGNPTADVMGDGVLEVIKRPKGREGKSIDDPFDAVDSFGNELSSLRFKT